MKNRHFTVILIVTAFVILALVSGGCRKSSGGGWIAVPDQTDNGAGKATFSYQMQCVDLAPGDHFNPYEVDTAWVRWNVQFKDHVSGVQFHAMNKYPGFKGPIFLLEDENCEDLANSEPPFCTELTGFYIPQPRGQFDENDIGGFYLEVCDNGEPGFSPGDTFNLNLTDGAFNGYEISGSLGDGGGNVQVF
jgi:hypothetical protein